MICRKCNGVGKECDRCNGGGKDPLSPYTGYLKLIEDLPNASKDQLAELIELFPADLLKKALLKRLASNVTSNQRDIIYDIVELARPEHEESMVGVEVWADKFKNALECLKG